MLMPRLNTVFASRWKAALWAGSILLFAWRAVPAPDEAPPEKAAKADPWAIDKSGK